MNELDRRPEFASQQQLAALFEAVRDGLVVNGETEYRLSGGIVRDMFPDEADQLGVGESLTLSLEQVDPEAESSDTNPPTVHFIFTKPDDGVSQSKSLLIWTDNDGGKTVYQTGWETSLARQDAAGEQEPGWDALVDLAFRNFGMPDTYPTAAECRALQTIMGGFAHLREKRDEQACNTLHGLLRHVQGLWSARESARAADVRADLLVAGSVLDGDLSGVDDLTADDIVALANAQSPAPESSPVGRPVIYRIDYSKLSLLPAIDKFFWADVEYAPRIPGQTFTAEGQYDPTLAVISATLYHPTGFGRRIVLRFEQNRLIQEKGLIEFGGDLPRPGDEPLAMTRQRSSEAATPGSQFALSTPEIENLYELITLVMTSGEIL